MRFQHLKRQQRTGKLHNFRFHRSTFDASPQCIAGTHCAPPWAGEPVFPHLSKTAAQQISLAQGFGVGKVKDVKGPLGNGGVWAEIGQAHPIRGLRTRQNYRNLPLFCWCCAFALPECSRGQCTPLVVASAVGHFDLSQVLKQVVQQSGLHKAMHHVS